MRRKRPVLVIKQFANFRKNKELNLDPFLGAIYPFSKINEAVNDLRENRVLRLIIAFDQ